MKVHPEMTTVQGHLRWQGLGSDAFWGKQGAESKTCFHVNFHTLKLKFFPLGLLRRQFQKTDALNWHESLYTPGIHRTIIHTHFLPLSLCKMLLCSTANQEFTMNHLKVFPLWITLKSFLMAFFKFNSL